MSQPILATKLFIPPPRSTLVSRARLLDQLKSEANRKLTLISAPAGYGKTTLLSDWVCQTEMPTGWLSLDEHDNDQKRFLACLIASLQSISIGLEEGTSSILQDQQTNLLEVFLIPLLNQISATDLEFALVLDDYYLIQNQEVHDCMIYLLDNLPHNMRLIIATRTDPPLRLAQLRAKGELCEIRAEDLRFTNQETLHFLNQSMGLELTPLDATTLSEKTEGWIVGLQLAAISLQGHPDKQAFIRAFAGDDRYIADYLLDETLEKQPAHIQAFLLQTSILDQLCAPLCDAVTGRKDSQQILDDLERANLFLGPLDNQRIWYRYHHLFADLLQLHLKRVAPAKIPALHSRASAWYESQDIINQAILHAIQAGDIQKVEEYVRINTFGMLEIGESYTVERWLNSLPAETVRGSLWLTIARGWTLIMTGNIVAGKDALENLEALAANPKYDRVQTNKALGQIAALRAYLSDLRGDPIEVERYAQDALNKLSKDDPLPVAIAAMMLATSYNRRGDTLRSEAVLQDALAIVETSPHSFAAIDMLCMYSKVQYLNGQLHESAATLQKAIDISRDNIACGRRQNPISGLIHVYRSVLLYEWDQLDEALDEMELGLRILKPCGYTDCVIVGLINLCLIHHARGDDEKAFAVINEASQISRKIPYWYARVTAVDTWLKALHGDTRAAKAWLREFERHPETKIELHRGLEYRYQAKIYLLLEYPEKAVAVLQRLIEKTQSHGAIDRLIRALALQAAALVEMGELESAVNHLTRALECAEAGGYVRVFIDEGESLAKLIYQVAQEGIYPTYCQQLLNAFAEETPFKYAETNKEGLVEPLSGRELEVLEQIALGSTNQEIAHALHLSLYTVKSHASNIFSKLGVKNRTEAAARGRLLGLIAKD